VYVGSDDGSIYKLDIESGMLLWQTATGGKARTSPALADGRIFAVSWDGFCYCLGKDDGKVLWKTPVAEYSVCSPAVDAGRVLLGDEEGFAPYCRFDMLVQHVEPAIRRGASPQCVGGGVAITCPAAAA